MEFSVIKLVDGLLLSDCSVIKDHQFLYNNKISHTIGWLPPNQSYPSTDTESPQNTPHIINNKDPTHSHAHNFITNHDITTSLQCLGIKSLQLEKRSASLDCMPTLADIEASIQAIEESRAQYLCTLVYAENLVEGLAVYVPYFVFRFGWSIDAAVGFVRRKLGYAGGVGGFQGYLAVLTDGLYGLLGGVIGGNNGPQGKLRDIQWTIGFLNSYESDDCEELVLINTLKNILLSDQTPKQQQTISRQQSTQTESYLKNKSQPQPPNPLKNKHLQSQPQSQPPRKSPNPTQSAQQQKKQKNNKRIQWVDQVQQQFGKNSITAGQRLFANSKISSSLKKSSSLKGCQFRDVGGVGGVGGKWGYAQNGVQDSFKYSLGDSFNLKGKLHKKKSINRLPSGKKLPQSRQQFQFDDLQYLSLKQLSRTNFQDLKFRDKSAQKRRSLKLHKKQQKINNSMSLTPTANGNSNISTSGGNTNLSINIKERSKNRSLMKIGQDLFSSLNPGLGQGQTSNNRAINFIQGIKVLDSQNNNSNSTLRA